ncbi:MAG: hypothetical protein AB1555_14120 [Nitrospirota bacterium]
MRLDVGWITATSTPEEVEGRLGQPPFTAESRVSVDWWYPIRAGAHGLDIPAVMLKVWLDDTARLDDWSFVHPVTGTRLPVRETLAQADAWFARGCNPPRRIELDAVLRKGTPEREVVAGLRWFPERLMTTFIEKVLVRRERDGNRETLVFYADRPSPLYVPPFYYQVSFGLVGERRTFTTIQGWGGCK